VSLVRFRVQALHLARSSEAPQTARSAGLLCSRRLSVCAGLPISEEVALAAGGIERGTRRRPLHDIRRVACQLGS
jgi:hypothetical protein